MMSVEYPKCLICGTFILPNMWHSCQPGNPGHSLSMTQQGCICPPGSERTCQGALCPRRAPSSPSCGAPPQ